MREQSFYKCDICGLVVGVLENENKHITCCGQNMRKIVAGEVEASGEKHIPVCEYDGKVLTVSVGSVLHPMEDKHFIEWIYVQTKNGGQRKILHAQDKPVAKFVFEDDEPICVYAYCNLHGLWKKEI